MCLQVHWHTDFHVFASSHSSTEEKPDFSEGIFLILDIHLYNYFLGSGFLPSCSPAPNWWLWKERYFLCFLLHNRKSPGRNALRGAWAWWALCLCPSSAPLCGATGTEDSWIWLCTVATQGWARQEASQAGKRHLLSQALSAVPRTSFNGTWEAASWAGRSVPGIRQEEVKSVKTRRTIPCIQQQRGASVVPVPWWARWGKQKPGREKHRREFGKRLLILALSSTSNSDTKDGATEAREHCLKGKWVQWNNTKKVLTIPNGN